MRESISYTAGSKAGFTVGELRGVLAKADQRGVAENEVFRVMVSPFQMDFVGQGNTVQRIILPIAEDI